MKGKAPVWTVEKARSCKSIHALYDKDGSGKINYKELVPALERYGVDLPKGTEAIDYILAYDTNPDGKLDYEEFEALVKDAEAGTLKTEPLPQNRHLNASDMGEGGVASLNPVMLFASADADGSGQIDFEEFEKLHGIIVKETEQRTEQVMAANAETQVAQAKGKRAKKLAIAASCVSVFVLFMNAALTMGIVFLAKDTKVDPSGKQLTKTGQVIQTGSLEEVIQTAATTNAFTQIVEQTDVLRTRPSAVIVDFADGSMVQFPPLQIQLFTDSALVANLQIGVKVSLERGKTPNFEFTGSASQLQERKLPTSASDFSNLSSSRPALAAISAIKIIRKLGGMEENGNASAVARRLEGETPSVPKSKSENERDTLLQVSQTVKSGLIPLVEDSEEPSAKPAKDTESAQWLLAIGATTDVTALCAALSSLGAACLDAASATASAQLSVKASKIQIQKFRDSAKTGTTYGVTSIYRELVSGAFIAGISRAVTHDEPHPIHLAHRRSLRETLLNTRAGRQLATRKARAYTTEPTSLPLTHKRRLGFGDADFFYKLPDAPTDKQLNVNCYDDSEPAAYAGTDVTTTYSGAACATWASAAAAFGVAETAAGICSIWGTPAASATLAGAYPRAACKGFLGDTPWCMVDNGGGSWGAATADVSPCSLLYLTELSNAYTPGAAGHDTTRTPIKPHWFWGLDRIQQKDAVYDTDPRALLFDGTGVHVFVIDTGCNLNHAEFAGRVGTSYRAYSVGSEGPVECDPSDTSKCIDNNGHGTHCASTILGAQAGVAPGAILHCVDVFDPALGGGSAGVDSARGLKWVIDYYKRELEPNGIPAILSASMGGSRSVAGDLKWRKPAEAGILTLAAAGNADSDACGYSPAGLGGDNGNLPLLTVGASNVDDSKALFSNWGSCVNLWSPGTGILAARHDSDTLMTVMSGTSMATPIAAGVAVLAMEVAGDASKQSLTHMATQDALNVKNWILHNALKNKITAVAPASIVPVTFVKALVDSRYAKNHYVIKNAALDASHCAVGDSQCLAAADASGEKANVASTPNLIAHLPEYMVDLTRPANACGSYDRPVYDVECPMPGTEICGDAITTAPDGTSIRRPYRKALATCTEGCFCDSDVKVTYESCAVAATDYRYTGGQCSPVYKVDTEETAKALEDLTLTWSPIPGADAYDEVDVSEGGIDTDCVGLKSNKFEIKDGTYYYTFKTNRYNMKDDGAWYFSTTYAADFVYYGKAYKKVLLYNNGYMCFADFVPPTGSFSSFEDHFDPARGPCFSYLMTDMESSKVERCSRVKMVPGGSWEADSLTFTFHNAPLFGGAFATSKPTVTVQVRLVFGDNKIEVRYGKLADSLSAIIGPSKGAGVPTAFQPPALPLAA